MARFTAIEIINMNAQLQVELALIIKLNAIVTTGKEFFVAGQDDPTRDPSEFIFIDLQSSPGHRFTYHHGHPTGGMISAITVDLNNHEQFKFTGLDTPIVLFEKDLEEHRLHAATELLLKGNDKIVGFPGSVLLGGSGNNTFILKENYGKETIVDWSALDKLAYSFAPNFDDYSDVMRNSHISHGELVIVDPNNPNNVTTIHGIDEKHDLRPSELLFLH